MRLQGIKVYKLLFAFFCLLNIIQLEAQKTGDEEWHQGTVILNDLDTINGLIKYSFQHNSIEYKKGNDYRRLLPGKFIHLEFTNSIDNKPHVFEVFKVKTSHDYYRPYFFEAEDTLGKIKIYKQYYWTKRVNTFGTTGSFTSTTDIVFNLYYVNNNGVATYIKQSKRKVLKLLKDKKTLVKNKAKLKRWRYSNTYDIVQIIKYYNSLF